MKGEEEKDDSVNSGTKHSGNESSLPPSPAPKKCVCRTCLYESESVDDMTAHCRTEHNREPMWDKPLRRGDLVLHEGVACRVERRCRNGWLRVRPLPPKIVIQATYITDGNPPWAIATT